MANTTNVRTSIEAAELLRYKTDVINQMRKSRGKRTLSQSQIIEIAIKKITYTQGVAK